MTCSSLTPVFTFRTVLFSYYHFFRNLMWERGFNTTVNSCFTGTNQYFNWYYYVKMNFLEVKNSEISDV